MTQPLENDSVQPQECVVWGTASLKAIDLQYQYCTPLSFEIDKGYFTVVGRGETFLIPLPSYGVWDVGFNPGYPFLAWYRNPSDPKQWYWVYVTRHRRYEL